MFNIKFKGKYKNEDQLTKAQLPSDAVIFKEPNSITGVALLGGLISLPIIVILCYLICEIYKILFKEKQEKYKYIPLLSSICGGILGILIYYTDKQIIFNVNSVWIALSIGIVSGASSTGANQIIKKLFK